MANEVANKVSRAGSSDGVWTKRTTYFTILDDLQIFPNEIGLVQIRTPLGVTDVHKAEVIQVNLGFNEVILDSLISIFFQYLLSVLVSCFCVRL